MACLWVLQWQSQRVLKITQNHTKYLVIDSRTSPKVADESKKPNVQVDEQTASEDWPMAFGKEHILKHIEMHDRKESQDHKQHAQTEKSPVFDALEKGGWRLSQLSIQVDQGGAGAILESAD